MGLRRLAQSNDHDELLRTQGELRILEVLLGDAPEIAAVTAVRAAAANPSDPILEGADYMDRDSYSL